MTVIERALQGKVVAALSSNAQTAEQIAAIAGAPDKTDAVYLLLEHLAANGRARMSSPGDPAQTTFAKA